MANERMINRVSVGVVYASAPGDYDISNTEKAHILTEVQEGLDALALFEPRSNLTWVYSALSAHLPSFIPWEGANWPGLSESFYSSLDAALWSDTNQKIYFFKGSEYIRVDPANGWTADTGYPKPIAGNWPGFPPSFTVGLSDALWSGTNQKIYFFKGDQYIRVDPNNGWNVDPGYPRSIAGNWPGFPADFATGIDAALWSETNQKIYFFKGDQYIRVDPNNSWNVDPGYPKPIEGNWPGFPGGFAAGLDAALWSETNQKIYFFKQTFFASPGQYIRVDPNNSWQVDPGYPKAVGVEDPEALWRDQALTQLGFSTGGAGISELTEFFQTAVSAQFGYVAFFTKMPTSWFAYAGGLRILMRKSGGSFTDWTSIDNVFAHETGHIFGAPDEYVASSSYCACGSYGKFIKEENGNCGNCSPANPESCLMSGNSLTNLCAFTPAHLGWRAFLDKIDAGLHAPTNDKLYMFSDNYYARYSDGFVLDPDYPKLIAGNWPGFPVDFSDSVDASLWSDTNQKIYFFKGADYIRVDPNNGWNVDVNYPKPISGNWPGFPADFASGVDAALYSRANQRLYFFKGHQYLRINPSSSWNVEAGYPKPIAGNWPGFPAEFLSGVDGAEWSDFNDRIYFFRGSKYIRVNPSAGWSVEAGYPKDININWRMAFPTI